ncbi:hypothetical protein BC832DRAFT_589610 [Gaertneriomyces semiglobifer]|nr:hypothetical protein BC832DRAFT_589610 [Gaertneriomyces semiglobifer]
MAAVKQSCLSANTASSACRRRRLEWSLNEKRIADALTDAESTLKKGESLPVEYATMLINACARKRRTDEAWDWLNKFLHAGIIPDAQLFNTLLYAYAQSADKAGLDRVLNLMHTRRIPPNVVTYTIIMNYYSCTRNPAQSLLTYADAVECGIVPDGRMNFQLLEAYLLQNEFMLAVRHFRFMVTAGFYSSYALWALVHGLAKAGKVEKAHSILRWTRRAGLATDVRTYTSLMHAYARQKLGAKVYRLFDAMRKSGIDPDVACYNVLVWTAVNVDKCVPKAGQFMRDMIEQKLQPDVVTVNIMLHGLVNAGEIERAAKILADAQIFGDVVTFTIMINGLMKLGHRGRINATAIFDHMKQGHLPVPDIVAFTVMIQGYARNRDTLPLAYQYFADLLTRGLRPDACVFNSLLTAHARFGDELTAVRLYSDMLNAGIKPTVETFTILIGMYTRQTRSSSRRSAEKAMHIFEDMLKQNIAPDALAFTAYVKAFVKGGDLTSLRKLLAEMRRLDVHPDTTFYRGMLAACVSYPMAAVSVLRVMLGSGIIPDARCCRLARQANLQLQRISESEWAVSGEGTTWYVGVPKPAPSDCGNGIDPG